MNRRLLDNLIAIVGSDRVLVAEDVRKEYARDKWPRWLLSPPENLPDCVVKPWVAADVSEILRLAKKEGIPVVPYGGGSGVCGAVKPERGGITIDVKDLNLINEPQFNVRSGEWFVWAQAGVIGEVLENSLNSREFTLGHFPASIS